MDVRQRIQTMARNKALQTHTDQPTNKKQVVSVTYGHNGGGKLYSYYATNKSTGDIVTPSVTNPRSGKTYRTLAVVRSTHSLTNAQDTINYIHGHTPDNLGRFINTPQQIKTIGRTDQQSLPGYHPGWDKDAQAAYQLGLEQRGRNDLNMQQLQDNLKLISQMRNQDKARFSTLWKQTQVNNNNLSMSQKYNLFKQLKNWRG